MENKSWNHQQIHYTIYGDFGDGLLLGSTGFAIKYQEVPHKHWMRTQTTSRHLHLNDPGTVLNGTYYDWMLDVKNIAHRIHGAGIYANIGGILMVNVAIYSIHGSYGIVNQSSYLTHSAFNISSQVRFTDPSTLQHFAQKVLSEDKDQQVHDVPHAWDDKLPAHHSSPQQLDIHVHHRVWNNGWITGCRDPLDGRGEFALLILQHVPSIRWCHHHRNHQKKPSPLFKTFKDLL